MDLLFKTGKNIRDNGLIEPGDHILVGVSGGIDSMVMVRLLMDLRDEIGFIISVAHVNHRLRGKDSDGDEVFVSKFCAGHGIPFHTVKWDGPRKGENLQEAARNFRYSSFSRIAGEIGAGKIALAHNLDDQAETILLNLLRGAGLDGICGMYYKRELQEGLQLIRPCLDISRSEIESFAKENGIFYRSDVSNDQTKYTRNFIRHKIMPLICEINPKAPASIAAMARLIQADEDYIHAEAGRIFDRILIGQDEGEIIINGDELRPLAPSIRTRVIKSAYIRMNGSVAGITRDHILKMDSIAVGSAKKGLYELPGHLHFKKSGSRLAIFRK